MPTRSIDRIARELTELKRQVRALASQPRLPYSSIEGGYLQVRDDDGLVRTVIGQQGDGSVTSIDVNGPPPVAPAAPTASGATPGLLTVTSYGLTADGSAWPLDLKSIEVHVDATSGFTPSIATKVAEFPKDGGVAAIALGPGVWYAVLVAVNTSGAASPTSAEASATVTSPSLGSGGIATYYTNVEPTGTIETGSLWYDTDNGNRLSRYDGTGWILVRTGTLGLEPGAVDDSIIAQGGLNPAKGIVDMRPGALTSFIHDWRFRDATLNAERTSGLTAISVETIQEELVKPLDPNFENVTWCGNVGDAPPAEYVAGPKTSLGNVINDTYNFLNLNVIPITVTSTLNPGDTVVSVMLDVTGRVGMTNWTGIATTFLNLDPATQNATLVSGDGVAGRTKIEWIATDGVTSRYPQYGTQPSTFDYYGHYDWATLDGDNFQTIPVPKYVKVSMIWDGPALAADASGHHAFILPGFSIWNIGGPGYQPGTPYIRMDQNMPDEEMTLLSGLPVTPGDRYALHVRRNPWSESVPYTGAGTSPSGDGDMAVRYHLKDGTTSLHGPGTGTGSFETAGWQHQTALLTMPDDIDTIDVVMRNFQTSDGATTHFILPRLTLGGWSNGTFGPGANIHDGGAVWDDPNGVPAINLDASANTGGATVQGYIAVGPRNSSGSSSLDRDSSLGIWTGGNDTGYTGSSQPSRVGIKLDPYYNTVLGGDAPFTLGGGVDGSAGAVMVVGAERGTTGTKAPKGFVGIVPGQYPDPAATAQEVGFVFDSDAGTITPVGSMAASGRMVGETIMWPGPVLPTNWLLCDGSTTTWTAHPDLHDAMSIHTTDITSFAAGTTVLHPSEGAAVTNLVKVGWQIAGIAIGGSNIATVTAVDTVGHTITISTPTAFGGPAQFWVYPYGLTAFGLGTLATFKLPDFRDRFPMGTGGTRKLGDTGGAETHTITTGEMPSHTHTGAAHTHGVGTLAVGSHTHGSGSFGFAFEYSANGATPGSSTNVHDISSKTGGGGTNASGDITGTSAATTPGISGSTASTTPGAGGSAGGGGAMSILNPLEAIKFIIYAGA
jgi:microcystin-dependent protein